MKQIILKSTGIAAVVLLRYHIEYWTGLLQLQEKGIVFLDYFLGFLYFVLILSFLRDILTFWYRKSKRISERLSDNIIVGVNNIYAILVVLTVIITVLGLFEINVRDLFAKYYCSSYCHHF